MLPSWGTKNTFITLDEVRVKWTGVATGSTSRLTLAIPWSG